MKRLIMEEENLRAMECLLLDLLNSERQLWSLGEAGALELADRISVFRAKLQSDLGVVSAFDEQKVQALHRLARMLKPGAVRREAGETPFDALARLYGWQTNDELERRLHSLESGEPG
jgi:hypothetical protein